MAVYESFLKQYQQLNQKPQTKGYFDLVATLVLLIVLIALIYPALKHITVLNRELSDARIQRSALEQKIQDIEQARDNLAAIESDLVLLDQALPAGSQAPSHVKRLEVLGAKNGLSLTEIDISDVPLNKPSSTDTLSLGNIPYTVSFGGTFDQFKQMLVDIENSIRSNHIETINLTKEDSGLKQTIGGKTFYLKLDNALENTVQVQP